MNTFENCMLTLPKFIQTTINKRCQILNPAFSGSIFEPKICLESLESAISRYIFSIYFKHKVTDVMTSTTQLVKPQKTLIEQIEIQIEEDESKAKLSEKDALEKLESLKKSIEDLVLNSPFFSFVQQKQSPYINPYNFEAKCSQIEETAVKSSLEAIWLPAINIGHYTITVGLFSLRSRDIASLIDDYLMLFVSRFLKSVIVINDKNKKEDVLSDDSWELLGDDEEEEKKVEEKNEPLLPELTADKVVPAESEQPQENNESIENNPHPPIQQHKEEKTNPDPADEKSEQDKSMKDPKVTEEEKEEMVKMRQKNKSKFVETLFEYTEQLQRLSDKKFKRREESCEGLLNRENNFLYALMSNNPA